MHQIPNKIGWPLSDKPSVLAAAAAAAATARLPGCLAYGSHASFVWRWESILDPSSALPNT